MKLLLSLLTIIPLFTPSTWNAEDAMDETPGYFRGEKTLTTTFNTVASESPSQSSYILCFDGVGQEAWVTLNGDSIGYHAGGYTRFSFDVTDKVRPGENRLDVRVSNAYNKNIPPLSADFTFFGGIYRHSYVRVTGEAYIAEDGVCITTPEVTDKKATVRIATEIVNRHNRKVKVVHTIIDPQGVQRTVHGSQCTVRKPMLWSPDKPQLYTLVTKVIDAKSKAVMDEKTTKFGLRYYRFDPNEGFFLNGQHIKLIGTNRHQCERGYGNALNDWQHERDMKMIKDMGANFVRISHYPQDHRVMEMCDSLGLLCSVEIPIVNAITENETFSSNCMNMLEEMIRQNRNHPSVVIWCYMNEVLLRTPFEKYTPRDSVYRCHVRELAMALNARCKELDKERYTMIAYNGDFKYNQSAHLHEVPEILGLNMYQGWYSGKLDGFEKNVRMVHETYPDKVVLITEYGADCDVRLRSKEPQRFDYTTDYALKYHQHYWPVIRDTEYIAGGAMWNFNDFHSETRGGAIPHFNLKGVVTTDRKPKTTYYYYQKQLTGQTSFTDVFPTANSMNYLLGTKRIFTDAETGEVWYPMDEAWIKGGEPYQIKTRHGRLPASDMEIYATDIDPIYQTAVVGANEIDIPAENGSYRVTLCLAELQKAGDPIVSVYNLGNDALKEEFEGRVISISVNGEPILTNVDLTDAYGTCTAHNESIDVDVTDGMIRINLAAAKGKTIMNAIKAEKK